MAATNPSAQHSISPFPSYLQVPDLHPRVRILCEIVAKCPVSNLESTLASSAIPPLPEYVDEVLKLSYSHPDSAIKFFRWAGLTSKHTPYSWNLMVDILGKNRLFEAMWDAIRSMKQEGVLSMATFASAFASYCRADKVKEAIMTFDVMEKYGMSKNVVAFNSLLSAICRENQTAKALEFYDKVKGKIPPDGDTFAILLEGWEKEGNATKAKTAFGEMIIRLGWNPENMSAYDAFLTTLIRTSQADEAIKFLVVMKGNNCLPGMKFFKNALDILIKQNDSVHALALWDILVGKGLVPTLTMYNSAISLFCNNNDIDSALRFLDEMVYHGVFPNSFSYNLIFRCLIKNKKVREAAKFFTEMTKNEYPPTTSNFVDGIKMFFDCDDPESAVEMWTYMIDNRITPYEESSNALLVGLRDMDRLREARRFMEKIIDQRIELYESTVTKMKNAFFKARKQEAFDSLIRRMHARESLVGDMKRH